MRITSGRFKNRKLFLPRGIRPTQEKVRKAVFDILGDIEGLTFLELFSGSGAVGLEAASRGASGLTLVESNPACIAVIKKNIESLGLEPAILIPKEAGLAIAFLHKRARKFEIIFLDPPYYEDAPKKALQTLISYDILAPDGFIIIQHFKRDNLPQSSGDLALFKQYKYGSTLLSFYKKDVPDSHISRNL